MEIIYRSDDGKEFTNKKDCVNYEKNLQKILIYLMLLCLTKKCDL